MKRKRNRSDLQRRQQEYWEALTKLLERKSDIAPLNPARNHMDIRFGHRDFTMQAAVLSRKKCIAVRFYCVGRDAKSHFAVLHKQASALEKDLNVEEGPMAADIQLQWNPARRGCNECHIALVRSRTDFTRKNEWSNQHQWLSEKLAGFHRVLSHRVKSLGN